MITWLKFKFIQLLFKQGLNDATSASKSILLPLINSMDLEAGKIKFKISSNIFYDLITKNQISYEITSKLQLKECNNISEEYIEKIREQISIFIFNSAITEILSRKDIQFIKSKKQYESEAMNYIHFLAKKEGIIIDKSTTSLIHVFDQLFPIDTTHNIKIGRPRNFSSDYFLYKVHEILKSAGYRDSLQKLSSINQKLKSLDNEIFYETPFSEEALKQALGRYKKSLSSIKTS